MSKQKVLFLDTDNSSRSQMAEGLLHRLGNKYFVVFSAGINPTTIDPRAIEAMDELDIDISNQESQSINDFLNINLDFIITVSAKAEESCPSFHENVEKIHWDIVDPTKAEGNEDEIMDVFTEARNEIESKIQDFIVYQSSNESF